MSRASLTLSICLSLGLGLTACGDDSAGGGAGSETDTDVGSTSNAPTTNEPTTGEPTTGEPTTGEPTTGEPTSDTEDPDTGSGDTTEGDTESETTGVPTDGTYYRINLLSVRDPHVFSPLPPNDDLTESTVNGPLTEALNMDEDEDGNLDLGLAVAFLPLDQTDGASEVFRFINSTCTAPSDSSTCSLLIDTVPFDGMYTVAADGECYAADEANLSDYEAPPAAPTPTAGPCFTSEIGTVTIAAGSFTLPLESAVVAAQFVGDPADGLVSGNIEGFVSTATAQSIQVETGMDFPPTVPLSALLRDADQDEGGSGWVFHISFEATEVDWMD